jgi:aminoglycoside phosphotransferase (APT) family kinase protein
VVTSLEDLEQIGAGDSPPAPVLTHNTLGPAKVRIASDGRIVVLDWWHAGGQPPAWELTEALIHWVMGNDRGTRAMVAGYRARAGSVPALELASFRGALVSLANYVHGQVHLALEADDAEDRRYTERNVRHLLGSLPTRADLEHLLNVATTG